MTNENQYRELFTPINIVTAVAVLALHTYIGFALAHMQVHQLKIPEIKEIAPIEVMLVKAMGQKSAQQHKSPSPRGQQPKVEAKPKPAAKPKQKPAAKIKPKPITKPKPVAKPQPKVVPKPIAAAKPVITVDKRLQQQRQWQIEQQREAEQAAKLKAEREVQLAATKRAQAEADARAAAKAAASKGSGGGATKAKGGTGSGGEGAANKAQSFSESDASWRREPNFKRLASIRTNARSGDVLKFSIKLTVDKQGNVTRAQVTRSSGYPRLDRAAERIAKKGKLHPFKNGRGNAVLGYVTLPFEYRVN